MQRQSRPPNPSDHGSSAVKETDDSERDPQPVGAAGAFAQTSRTNNGCNPISTGGGEGVVGGGRGGAGGGGGGGEPDSWCSKTHANPIVPQKRSNSPSCRPSSEYISDCDSLPSASTLVVADKSTQTPSFTGQVMTHALQSMAQTEEQEQAQGGGPGTHQQHGHAPNPLSTRRRNGTADMQAVQLGQALRLIGDKYNDLVLKGEHGKHKTAGILDLLLHVLQEPVALLYVSFLLLVIGWIMYL